MREGRLTFGKFDPDLLSRAIRLTIIGAALFHGPVRDGKGWYQRAMGVKLKRFSPRGAQSRKKFLGGYRGLVAAAAGEAAAAHVSTQYTP